MLCGRAGLNSGAGKGEEAMDFHISDQQREMVASVRDLAQSVFKANAMRWMDGTFPGKT